MAQKDFNPFGKNEPLTGHGEVSEGVPPRQTGDTPGYGVHGMGYAHGSGGQFGVYGVPHGVAQDYVEGSRAGSPGEFDQPHGRVGFGWEGGFGSEGEYSARTDRIRPARQPSSYAPEHEEMQSQRNVRRGPRNYTRSDDRIQEEIFDAIEREPRIDASDVTIEVQGGKVTLLGAVAHRQMKHWIEDIAADCYGVADVDNKLTVALAEASPADRKMSPRGVGH
jgi:hypothetical protein